MTKKLVKLAASLLAIGGVLLLIGALMGGFQAFLRYDRWPLHWGSWHETSDYNQHLELSEDSLSFHTLDVSIALGDVRVEQGDRYEVEIDWVGSSGDFVASAADGTLTVGSRDYRESASLTDATVRIVLPEGETLQRADLHTNLGDIHLDGVTVTGSLNADTDLGDVRTEDVSVNGGVTAHSNLGDIRLDGSFPCDVSATTNMGEVRFITAQSAADYTCTAETDLGEVHVDGWAGEGSRYHGGSGSSHLKTQTNLGDIRISYEND